MTKNRLIEADELTRVWADAKPASLGKGGIAIVKEGTWLSRTTIRIGRDELRASVDPSVWGECAE